MNHLSLPVKWLLAVTALLSISSISCTKADINFGSQYVGDSYTQLVTIDTFAPQISTLYVDSFVTNASGTALMGIYNDPDFGRVSSTSFFELTCPSFVSTADYSGTLLDSIALVLNPTGNYYGDTTKSLTLNVYKLPVNIEYKNNNQAFYNKDSIGPYSELLGSKTFNLRPHGGEMSIRLSDDLGNTLLQLYKDKGADVQSTTNFVNYFKGIAIGAAGNDGCMMGVKDSITMRLYYRLRSATRQDSSIVFTLNNREHQFNHITIDRTGSVIAGITSKNNLISSELTQNAAYIQAITGTIAKIQFPALHDLLKIPGYTKLTKAVLAIRPVTGTFNSLYYLPDSLRLSTTDITNKTGTSLTNSAGDVQYGSLQVDNLYNLATYYSYDVTSYISSALASTQNSGDGLLLSPPENTYDVSFSRLVAGDALNSKAKIQLFIYYLSIK